MQGCPWAARCSGCAPTQSELYARYTHTRAFFLFICLFKIHIRMHVYLGIQGIASWSCSTVSGNTVESRPGRGGYGVSAPAPAAGIVPAALNRLQELPPGRAAAREPRAPGGRGCAVGPWHLGWHFWVGGSTARRGCGTFLSWGTVSILAGTVFPPRCTRGAEGRYPDRRRLWPHHLPASVRL